MSETIKNLFDFLEGGQQDLHLVFFVMSFLSLDIVVVSYFLSDTYTITSSLLHFQSFMHLIHASVLSYLVACETVSLLNQIIIKFIEKLLEQRLLKKKYIAFQVSGGASWEVLKVTFDALVFHVIFL